MRQDLANQPHLLGRHLIYIVDEAAWAEGIVYATWIDMMQSLASIQELIDQFLAKSPVPGGGFLIKDYQGFYSLKIGPRENLELVHEKALFIGEHGLLGVRLLQYYGGDIKTAQRALRYGYQGCYKGELEYSREFFDSQHLNQIPGEVRDYIDYPRFQRDLFANNHFSIFVEEHCHVFRRI